MRRRADDARDEARADLEDREDQLRRHLDQAQDEITNALCGNVRG